MEGEVEQSPIDITMIATMRPEVITQTLGSITQYVKCKSGLRLILDVAPVGVDEGVNQEDIVAIAKEIMGDENVIARTRKVSLQAEAQRWVWSRSESEHVLQWEDDWVATRTVNLDNIIPLFDEFPDTAMVFIDRVGKSVRNYQGYHGMFRNVKRNVYRRIKHKNFGGPPAVICRPFIVGVCNHIKDDESLDITCRTKAGQKFLKDWEFLVYSTSPHGMVSDIGKMWRAQHGLKMSKKTKYGVRWEKIK